MAYLEEPLLTDSLTTLVAVSRSSERSGKSTEFRCAEKRWYIEGSRRALKSQKIHHQKGDKSPNEENPNVKSPYEKIPRLKTDPECSLQA